MDDNVRTSGRHILTGFKPDLATFSALWGNSACWKGFIYFFLGSKTLEKGRTVWLKSFFKILFPAVFHFHGLVWVFEVLLVRWLQNFRTAFDVEVQIELKSSNRMREGRFDRIFTLQHFPLECPNNPYNLFLCIARMFLHLSSCVRREDHPLQWKGLYSPNG